MKANKRKSNLLRMLESAWIENPGLALQFSSRFQFPRLNSEIRSLVLKNSEKAIEEPDALALLLESSLPGGLNTRFKVFLVTRIFDHY